MCRCRCRRKGRSPPRRSASAPAVRPVPPAPRRSRLPACRAAARSGRPGRSGCGWPRHPVEQGEEHTAVQRLDADGCHLLAVNANRPPVAARIGRHPGDPGEDRGNPPRSRGGHGTKSQAEPERPVLAIQPGGVDQRARLAPKTSAATTAATATAVPVSALRTGTALRPRPGSKAIRAPIAAVGAPPRPASAAASRDRAAGSGCPEPRLPPAPAACQAAGAMTSTGRRAMATSPRPRTPRFTCTPGSGSASRAGPIGINADAATAITTATQAPAVHTTPARSIASQNSCRRGPQRAQDRIVRGADDQLQAQQLADDHQPARPASPANRASASACGRIACSTFAC